MWFVWIVLILCAAAVVQRRPDLGLKLARVTLCSLSTACVCAALVCLVSYVFVLAPLGHLMVLFMRGHV